MNDFLISWMNACAWAAGTSEAVGIGSHQSLWDCWMIAQMDSHVQQERADLFRMNIAEWTLNLNHLVVGMISLVGVYFTYSAAAACRESAKTSNATIQRIADHEVRSYRPWLQFLPIENGKIYQSLISNEYLAGNPEFLSFRVVVKNVGNFPSARLWFSEFEIFDNISAARGSIQRSSSLPKVPMLESGIVFPGEQKTIAINVPVMGHRSLRKNAKEEFGDFCLYITGMVFYQGTIRFADKFLFEVKIERSPVTTKVGNQTVSESQTVSSMTHCLLTVPVEEVELHWNADEANGVE